MAEIIFGAAVFLICLATLFYSRNFPQMLSGPGSTGAEWFPDMICIALMICCAVLICQAIMRLKKLKAAGEKEAPVFNFKGNKYGTICLLITVAATIVFVLLIGKIHFIIIASAYMIGLGLLYGISWKKIIPISIVSAAVLFFVFHNVLNIMLNG